MTIDPVAPRERSLVRFATPYLEVEAQSISSLEHDRAGAGAGEEIDCEEEEGKGGDQLDHKASIASSVF